MDIHPIPRAAPTEAERGAVDGLLGAPGGAPGGRGRSLRHLLLPVLRAVQGRVGWISPGALDYVCRRLTVPPAEAYGVASFYALLATEPRPPRVAHVCDDIACRTSGAEGLCAELARRIGPDGHHSRAGGSRWVRSPCLGLCEQGPAVLVQAAGERAAEWTIAPAKAEAVEAALRGGAAADGRAPAAQGAPARAGSISAPQTLDTRAAAGLTLLRRVGRVDPGSLDEYRADGGYEALRRALSMGPAGVIREILDSKLVGRGGAAFPAGRKWEAVARAPVRPHHLVCNADESEPGTFKDRVLMEEDPFRLAEAMTISGFATGCETGWIYVRGEYPLAAERLRSAVERVRSRGLLGADVMGAGIRFDIEIRQGAGAYICGEETALFNSIEGLRGEPRNKPPFPTECGLFGKPTLVNNVETLANVPEIVLRGGPAFAAVGTPQSTGTKLFCLSGCVERPGVYEVPFGATLGALLDLAGGVRGGRPLRAVLLGGAAGSFAGPGELGVPLTFEGTRAAGLSLGSGVVMAFDDRTDLADVVVRIAAFFRDESCGQCVPCRVGTERQEEILRRLASGRTLRGERDEIALLDDVAQAMRDASICGLGQTAAGAAQSAVRKLGLFAREGRAR